MRIVNYPEPSTWPQLLKRPSISYADLIPAVDTVFEAVRLRGDQAVQFYTEKYDNAAISNFKVDGEALTKAESEISPELAKAIKVAKQNIEKFHKAQETATVKVETMPGVQCWQEKKPIERVGLYIPGGSAPLFSTVLMLCIPAAIAGCKEIILCTPPGKEGVVHPAIRFAANLCGLKTIYRIGGIQAIAAMTFGTASIPAVYKIFGPGNQYVTAAKQLATSFGVSIDMPAGPSELMVVADENANPAYTAADLLSQAEHGPDSQVLLLTTSQKLLDSVNQEITKQLQALPRAGIAASALENSLGILVNSTVEALGIVNYYAPEHLIINLDDEEEFCAGILNAGSVFLGKYTPESAGDYASGTNHTLPTNGYAKQYSGVNLDSFTKSITYQKLTKEGLAALGPSIAIMAENEELMAHKNAVMIRMKEATNQKPNAEV